MLLGGDRRRSLRNASQPETLLKPPADSWLTYHGDYSGQRHSKLSAITPANVHQLTLAWAFQTKSAAGLKATPILANGVIYLSAPDNSGRSTPARRVSSGATRIRRTTPSTSAIAASPSIKDFVYLTTPDAHLVALDARDGQGALGRRDCRREARVTGRRTRRW